MNTLSVLIVVLLLLTVASAFAAEVWRPSAPSERVPRARDPYALCYLADQAYSEGATVGNLMCVRPSAPGGQPRPAPLRWMNLPRKVKWPADGSRASLSRLCGHPLSQPVEAIKSRCILGGNR